MNLFEKCGGSSGGPERPWWNGKLRYIPIAVIVFFLALGGGRGMWSGSGSNLPGDAAEAASEESETGENDLAGSGSSGISGSDSGEESTENSAADDSGMAGNSPETSGVTGDGTGDTTGTAVDASETGTAELTVFVCGAVRYPGVYTLAAGGRVTDAVGAAGGFLDDADTEYWNLAEPLSDGEQIRIPTEAEAESMAAAGITASGTTGNTGIISGTGTNNGGSTSSGSGTGSSGTNGLVNLNTADASELMTLTGIGETRAAAIIAYREENGPFQSIEDIMNVSGIKEGSYAKIKDSICVQ